jgi:hypothetical protein
MATRKEIEKAVDYCFRLIGGAGYTFERAIPEAAERFSLAPEELSAAYDRAIAIAAEAD